VDTIKYSIEKYPNCKSNGESILKAFKNYEGTTTQAASTT